MSPTLTHLKLPRYFGKCVFHQDGTMSVNIVEDGITNGEDSSLRKLSTSAEKASPSVFRELRREQTAR